MARGIDRREVLLGGLGLGGMVALGSCASAALRRVQGSPLSARAQRSLVVLQLSGGDDGLSLLVPYADDAYHSARPKLAFGEKEVLRLDERRGLHPALSGLRTQWEAGRLALVEGVGHPDPNRSHFRSMDIWQAGDLRGRAVGEGWIGRLVRAAFDQPNPSRVVHVGQRVPFALFSKDHAPVAFSAPEAYRWIGAGAEAEEIEQRIRSPRNPSAALVRRVMQDAGESSALLSAAVARYRPTVDYPASELGGDLRTAAALLHGDAGCRVVSVELSGFDTHNDQRRRHDELMRTLDAALSAFLDDLDASEIGRGTVVLAFSEFGRRVAENASGGTDHGAAAPVLVAGASVRGGFHGASPSLDQLADGDLVSTTDFRAVYAALIRGCFGVEPAAVLGGEFGGVEVLG